MSRYNKSFWFFFSKKNRFRFPLSALCSIALHQATDWISGMKLRALLLTAIVPLLSGCSTAVFRLWHPDGPVSAIEWRFTLIDVGVMLLIILPVTLLIAVFVWRYRKSRNAKYDPTWSHSLGLELAMWGIPFLTVIFLGYESYRSTLLVNPYNPTALNYTDLANPPLQVDVVTTDWQWFFIYPQYGIATVDDLVIPAGRPVKAWLTSTSVTNDFFIPEVAPMIDVMPGMRTMDGFQVNHPGHYEGFAADYSGAGFSWMQFSTHILGKRDFDKWVAATQASPDQLSYAAFTKLAVPTVNVGAKPAYFSHVDSNLFMDIYNAARAGTVYAVPDAVEIPAASVDYTQGKNGAN
jgi:cytochrome o ubiquinol oxidase subunit 2